MIIRCFRNMLTIGLFFVFFITATIEADTKPVELAPLKFNELMREETPVSGNILKGVFLSSNEEKINPAALFVTLPENVNQSLFVVLSSRDGRYFAEAEYLLKNNIEGLFRLHIITDYQKQIEQYRIIEMAVIGYIQSNRPDKPDLIMPFSWGFSKQKKELVFLVNSGGADVRIYDPETDQFFFGADATGDSRIAYDTECVVNVSERSGEAKFILLRNRYETPLKNMDLRIWIP